MMVLPLRTISCTKTPMQALAMGSEFALSRGETATGGLVSSAVFPAQAAFLDTPFGVIVLRVVGASSGG